MQNLSLMASRKLIRDLDLQEAFDHNPDEVIDAVRAASAEVGRPVDISEAKNANVLRKARAATSEFTTDVVNEYVREPLQSAFGDNTATRVISGGVEGLAQSLPEIALLGVTRGRNPAFRLLGTASAGLGSGIQSYNQSKDPTSALVSGATMAALPTATRGLQRGAAALGLGSLSRGAQMAASGALGAGAGLAGDVVDFAYQPRMEEVSLGPLGTTVVPAEGPVAITDFSKAAERLTALDPRTPEGLEQLAIMGISELGPATVGLAMDRARGKRINVQRAQQELTPLNSDTTNPVNYLTDLGRFDIPEKASRNQIDLSYRRYLQEDEPARMDIQYALYDSVPEDTLTPDQLARKRELADPVKRAQYAVKNLANLGTQPSPAETARDTWAMTLGNIADDLDPNFNPEHQETGLSRALNAFGRKFFDAPQAVETNPVAREIQNRFTRNSFEANNRVNRFIHRLGSLDESESYDVASHNLRSFINDFRANKNNLKTIAEEAWLARQQSINRVAYDVDAEGNRIEKQVRPSIFDEVPDLTIEQWKARGVSDRDARILRNISQAPTFLALDSFNSSQSVLTNQLARQIMDITPTVGTSQEAYSRAKRITDQAKLVAAEGLYTRQMRERQESYNPDWESYKDLDRRLSTKLADALHREVFGNDPNARDAAERMGIALYKAELGIAQQYARNKTEGYMPLVRRGKYKLAWTAPNGEKLFRGFNDKKEFDAFWQELKESGAENIHDYSNNYNEIIDAQAFDQVASIRRSIMEARELLRSRWAEANLENDATTRFLNELMSATKVFENQYKNVARTLSQADIKSTTTLERRNIGGINPDDLLPNLFELIESTARANQARTNASQIDMLLNDPAIRNNKDLVEYFGLRRKYMSNPDTPEWIPLRNFVSLNYLAASPGFVAQNATQPYIIGSLMWKQHTGRSIADFVAASRKATDTIYSYENDPKFKGVDKTILKFLRRGVEDGVFDQSVTDETFARRKLKASLADFERSKPAVERAKDEAEDLLHWATQTIAGSEELNRKTSFVQFLESENRHRPLSERTPQELENIYNRARDYTDAVNFRGGKANRPELLINASGLNGKSHLHGALLLGLTLTNYSRNFLGIMFNRLRDAVPGLRDFNAVASKQYKNNRDRLALVKILAAFGAAAGVEGLPMAEVFDEAAVKLGGSEAYRPSRNIRKALEDALLSVDASGEFGKRIADGVMYGIPGLFGWNQQNIGMSGLIPFPASASLVDAFGAPGSLAANSWDAVKAAWEHDIDSFMRSTIPTGVKSFQRALTALNEGAVRNNRGEAVVGVNTLKSPTALSLLVGGAPVEVSEARNMQWRNSQQQARENDARRNFMTLLRNNVGYPDRLDEAIKRGVASGVLPLDSVEDVDNLMMTLAEASLRRNTPYARYNRLDYIPTLRRVYAQYGVDPEFVPPLQQTVEAIRIASSLKDMETVGRLMQKFNNDSMLIRDLLYRKGVDPQTVSLLLKTELNREDVEKIKVGLDESRNRPSF